MRLEPDAALPTQINGAIEALNTYIDSHTWEYLGFCPHDPKGRFAAILDFQYERLIQLIRSIDDKFFESHKMTEITESVKESMSVVAKHREMCAQILNKRCLTRDVHGEKLEDYIDAFVGLYEQALPVLLEKEKKWIEIAKEIERITDAAKRLFSI